MPTLRRISKFRYWLSEGIRIVSPIILLFGMIYAVVKLSRHISIEIPIILAALFIGFMYFMRSSVKSLKRERTYELKQYSEVRMLTTPVSTQRVVNVTFNNQGQVVDKDQPLLPCTNYDLQVWVGGFEPQSIVQNPAAIPDKQLQKLMSSGFVDLRVVISSPDFTLIDQEKPLELPRKGKSDVVTFKVITPQQGGMASLRVVLYYKNNALQSILVTAGVSAFRLRRRQPLAVSAVVEYCFSGTLENIERYPARNLNILTNESGDTHTFSIKGTNIRENFTFTEGEMKTSLQDTRQKLLTTCVDLDSNGKPKTYRYTFENEGTQEQFVKDIKTLAVAGYGLYVDFITKRSQPFQQKLRAVLDKRANIQISAVKSAKYVFPWALVYDKSLLTGPENEVCKLFLQQMDRVKEFSKDPDKLFNALEASLCLSGECPNKNDSNVICPSAFWGFKHILEQPPSVPFEPDDGGDRNDVLTNLKIKGQAKMVMTVSRQLEYIDEHVKEVSKLKQYAISLNKKKSEMFKSLKASPSPDFIYLYCHGGKEGGKGFLSVGDHEQVWTTDLAGAELSWPSSHPLVFINGCRTAELTPDDLLGFVELFVWCQASGVIGTEISIPESLAREFATAVFKSLATSKTSIGEAILRQRLLLLAKYNPLGLAYTPYCHAGLQFEFGD